VTELRWGILATGTIAKAFARHLPTSETGRLVAVASRDVERARGGPAAIGARAARTARFGMDGGAHDGGTRRIVAVTRPHENEKHSSMRSRTDAMCSTYAGKPPL
jgi:hypothetical protein